jgi:hypothetical protein
MADHAGTYTATLMILGWMPRVSAAEAAMGYISAAVALLVSTSDRVAVTR